MSSEIRDRIKLAREKTGLSQEAAAEKANVTQSTWSLWEGGTIPRGGNRVRIGLALGVNPEWLRTGEGPMELDTARIHPMTRRSFEAAHLGVVDEVLMDESAKALEGYLELMQISMGFVERTQMAARVYREVLRLGLSSPDRLSIAQMGEIIKGSVAP